MSLNVRGLIAGSDKICCLDAGRTTRQADGTIAIRRWLAPVEKMLDRGLAHQGHSERYIKDRIQHLADCKCPCHRAGKSGELCP